jgi:hypothetical protein
MKIKVSYGELVSGPGYNNRQASAEIELDVNSNVDAAFEKAWKKCKNEVNKQLHPEMRIQDDDIPF